MECTDRTRTQAVRGNPIVQRREHGTLRQGGAFLPIRRSVQLFLSVLVVVAVMVTTGCRSQSAKSSGLIPVRLQTDWYPQPEHGGFYMAQAKGHYQQDGLDVKILPGRPDRV